MPSTDYAAMWQEADGVSMAGQIRLDASALSFEGAVGGRVVSRRIACDAIASSRLGRGAVDRVGGLAALVIELNSGETIRVATLELGALHELAEALKIRTTPIRSSGDKSQRNDSLVDDGTILGG